MYSNIFFGENVDNGTRERLINQFKTILDGRSDIRNLGIIGSNGRKLINEGKQSVNPDLKLSTQEWYLEALQKPEGPLLTSSHVQHIISGERPWVITLSRGIRNFSNSGEKEGVFFIDLNYSATVNFVIRIRSGKRDTHSFWMKAEILYTIPNSSSFTMNCRLRIST